MIADNAKMVLDSNTFIEAKNRFYAFDICPGYWQFLEKDFGQGNAISVMHVREEVLAGNDDLSDWFKNNLDKHYFADCQADEDVLARYREVSSFVTDNYAAKPNAIFDFLSPNVADPWLVAYVLAYGGIIVTQETSKLSKRKVSLIDVCDHFGIEHINIYDFLRAEKAKFILASS